MIKYQYESAVGEEAYKKFKKTAEREGFEVTRSTDHDDIFNHIDAYIKKDDLTASVDVKAMKKISRYDSSSQDKYTYVEFRNVKGEAGWIYGKADIIAFETKTEFIGVDRVELLEYCNKIVDFKSTVNYASDALNKVYTRSDRKDLISLIELDKIPTNIKFVWIK